MQGNGGDFDGSGESGDDGISTVAIAIIVCCAAVFTIFISIVIFKLLQKSNKKQEKRAE